MSVVHPQLRGSAAEEAGPDEIRQLSRVHSWISLLHVSEVWFVIAAVTYVSGVWLPPWSGLWGGVLYCGAVAVISARQHALMVLTHEAIHKRLCGAGWLNDWLARALTASPILISLSKWRFIHLCHHRYTHGEGDPDRAIYARYPLSRERFWRLLARDLLALNVFATLQYFIDLPWVAGAYNRRFLGEDRARHYRAVSDMWAFWLFWLAAAAVGVYAGGSWFVVGFVLYWIVPYCTLTQVFFRLRGAIEHGNVPDPRNPYRQTRTYGIDPVLAFFLSPKNVNYHLEHHLYPSVPFCALPRLHRLLARRVYPHERGYCEPFWASLRTLTSVE